HFFQKLGVAAAGLILAATPVTPALAEQATTSAMSVATAAGRPQAGQSAADFYRARKDAPLWFSPTAGDAAQQLISLLSTASLDGLSADRYQPAALQAALNSARKGKRKLVGAADRQLSDAFAAYVADMKRDPGVGVTYVDPSLRPMPPMPLAALLEAASSPSLSEYVRAMGWMHPMYGQLRDALAQHK